MYEDIIRLLDNKRLKEALDKLEALVAKAENWEMGSEVERLKTTYGYMLQYASQGVKDRGGMKCIVACADGLMSWPLKLHFLKAAKRAVSIYRINTRISSVCRLIRMGSSV